jgi:hypothetical protein
MFEGQMKASVMGETRSFDRLYYAGSFWDAMATVHGRST